MNFFRILFLLILLSSCTLYKDIDVQNTENVKFERLEGREVFFTLATRIDNPNWYNLKIKPGKLEVFIDDAFAGTIHLDDKVSVKRKNISDVNLSIRGLMEEGLMLRLLKLSSRESVKVNIKGKIKGGTWFYKKKFEVDETKNISPKGLMSKAM